MMSQEKIWDHFQNAGVAAFADSEPRQRFLIRRLRARVAPRARILNIGIGGGMLETLLHRDSFAVSALDPNENAVMRLRGAGIDSRVGVAEALPFESEAFDAVVASEVIEHLDDDQLGRALGEIDRVLKPGGLFIGTVPFNERLSDGETVCPNCGHQFHRWGHRRSFTVDTLAETLGGRFERRQIIVRSFVNRGGGLRPRAKSIAKWILGRFGEPIASPHLFFECSRPREPAG